MSSAASAQVQRSGVVYDMFTRAIASRFDAGDQPRGAVWNADTTAFIANPQVFMHMDMTNPGFPVVAGSTSPLSFPLAGNGVPGPFAINSTGSRAYIAGVMLGTMSGVGIYDLTTPDPSFMTVIAPATMDAVTGAAIALGGAMAVFPAGQSLFFADLTADPMYTMTPTYPFRSQAGAALTGVNAAFTSSTAVAVSLADGGMQLIDIGRLPLPPRPIGDVIRPDGCSASPAIFSIPTRFIPDHVVALSCPGAPSEVVVVDLEGGQPAILSTVVLPAQFNNAQAIALNPLTGDIYVASTQAVGVVTYSSTWASLDMTQTINLIPQMQIAPSGLAVSPDGHFLMVTGQTTMP